MVHLLTQQDYEIVQAYLDEDPLHNIYPIHGLQTYGLENDRVTFWGAFNGDRLEGVLFANRDGSSNFGGLAGDNPRVLARLGKLAMRSGIRQLIGKSTYIQPAIEHLSSRIRMNVQRLNFYEAYPEQFARFYDYPVRAATRDDVPMLVELYKGYEFYSKDRTDEENADEIRRVMENSGVYFLTESKGQVVSAARVFPETDRAGMVGRARTLPEFRGHGVYSSVRTACYEYLFEKGKVGVSFSLETNASIQRVLNKFGASPTAKWLLVSFREKSPLRQRILPLRLRRWGLSLRDRVVGC